MLVNRPQGLVCRSTGPKPVGAIFKVCFKDRLQDQQHGCLNDSIPHRRYTQRAQFAVLFLDIHPPYRLGAVGVLLEASLQLGQKNGFAFRAGCNLLDAYSIDSGCPVVALHGTPSSFQRVPSTDVGIQTVEAKSLLLFGFLTELLSQLPEGRRQKSFPKGYLFFHLFCPRILHPISSSGF